MSTDLAEVRASVPADLQEKVLLGGDLARLTPAERLSYYNAVCTSVGLNPLTRPFEYLILNGKMTLYARKDCADQLRDLHGISITIVGRELVDGVYVVTAQAKNMTERTDESIGAVPLPPAPADKANAMMKAETKAKRRVTLSICGLGILDETELDTVPQAKVVTGEVIPPSRKPSDILKEMEQIKTEEPLVLPPASHNSPAPPLVVPPVDTPIPSFIWKIGKEHKDESIATIPDAYLDWFVQNGKREDHVEAANLELDRRRGQGNLA